MTAAQIATAQSHEAVDADLLRWLADPSTHGSSGSVQTHETHASWVFVAGERALKIKKRVDLGFLDYSTLSRRHAACREEVRVNRELAPGIYLGVRAIVSEPDSFRFAADGAPAAIEYAVAMRSFRESDTLAAAIAAGHLESEHIRAIATRIARFHREAIVVAGGSVDELLAMWQDNLAELAEIEHPTDWQPGLVGSFASAFVRAHEHELSQRRLAGLVRDGHGDLRCEHVLLGPTVRVVDRIEFDAALRHTDIACDLAFLTMDLEFMGAGDEAAQLLSAYRAEGLDPGSESLRSFYAAHHAFVRAKVALLSGRQHMGDALDAALSRARELWALGERLCWRARCPVAVVVCGPAASGKSTLTVELSRRSGMPVVSSDVVRKAAAGLASTQRGDAEIYTPAGSRRAYELLGRAAQRALARGSGVIVDATCRSQNERSLLLAHLNDPSTAMLVVECRVSLEVALERATRRLADSDRISDATPQIVAQQHRSFEPLLELPARRVLSLNGELGLDEQVVRVARAVDGQLVSNGGYA
ncbi:MAG TPA: AAA family ATPase [Solirubrobacteraceae bacterium]|nr:AAA family ATPase [Solirubrobacteraceae bacterium]